MDPSSFFKSVFGTQLLLVQISYGVVLVTIQPYLVLVRFILHKDIALVVERDVASRNIMEKITLM